MPIDPTPLSSAASPSDASVGRFDASQAPPLSEATPHIGHTAMFLAIVALSALFVSLVFAMLLRHVAPHLHEPLDQMQTDPRLVVPLEAVLYGVATIASFAIFPLFWGCPFGEGIHWCWAAVKRHRWALVAIGVVTSVVVQVLSNFLPIPKELPIDKFFTNRVGVWLIAIFGVTVAPAFEELAFRGFLLPSLATAWDWTADWMRARRQTAVTSADADGNTVDAWAAPESAESIQYAPPLRASLSDPRWSMPAVIFSTIITSIGFAMLHGAQLAHSFAPLTVLFGVSVVLCVTRVRFHSLAASTVVHSMYNATIFLLLFIGTGGFRHLDKLGS